MRRAIPILFLLISTALPFLAQSQGMTGLVIYSQSIKMDFNRPNMPEHIREMLKTMPKEQTFLKQLLFSPEATLYKAYTDPNEPEPIAEEGRGGFMRMMMMRAEEETYSDFANNRTIEKKDLFGRTFLIKDSLEKFTWKITGQSKEIQGYLCMQATGMLDTLAVEAWFCPALSVPSGPEGLGQLPGLILECALRDGMVKMVAQSVELRPLNKGELAEPDKGKVVTREEYRAIVKAKREEMKEMGGRGGMFGGGH